jgi:hypothetical protein
MECSHRIRIHVHRWIFLKPFECARSAWFDRTTQIHDDLVREPNLSAPIRKRGASPLMRDASKKTTSVRRGRSKVMILASDDKNEEDDWGEVDEISD